MRLQARGPLDTRETERTEKGTGARIEDIHAARHSSLFGRRTDNRRKQRLGTHTTMMLKTYQKKERDKGELRQEKGKGDVIMRLKGICHKRCLA